MAALSQEAELNRARPSVLICSQFGHKRPIIEDMVSINGYPKKKNLRSMDSKPCDNDLHYAIKFIAYVWCQQFP
jgi:hypothetical protein